MEYDTHSVIATARGSDGDTNSVRADTLLLIEGLYLVRSGISIISFALWDTLLTENPRFKESVQRVRMEIIRQHLSLPQSQEWTDRIADAYERASTAEELGYFRGQLIDNNRRIDNIANLVGARISGTQKTQLRIALEASHPAQGIDLIEGVTDMLISLKRTGKFRLVVMSDTWMTSGVQLRKVIERSGLSSFIDHYQFSDEATMTKYRPEAFTHLAASLNTEPAKCAHVGDLKEVDIYGAVKAGFAEQILIKRDNHPLRFPLCARSSVAPTKLVRGLSQITSYLNPS